MSMKKEVQQLLDRARADGWTVEKTKGSHYKLTHPSGALVYCSYTPSDYHAIKNIEGDMRRGIRVALANSGRRR